MATAMARILEHDVPSIQSDMILRALILDDQEVDRMRLGSICRKAGLNFELTEASDIAGLRKRLDETEFDFVFIDYHLGMETGLAALRVLTSHENQNNAVPIMVTSHGDHNVIITAMRSGCADYLIKDEVTVEALHKSVNSALERRILLAALSRERAVRRVTAATVERFSQTCAPEMRRILSTMMRRLRKLQSSNLAALDVRGEVGALHGSCDDLFSFLDEMTEMFEATPSLSDTDSGVVVKLQQ